VLAHYDSQTEDEQFAEIEGKHSTSQSLIISDPAVMMGKPAIAGMRITVEVILEKLASGESVEQLLAAHPRLTKEAVLEAIDCAAKKTR
jgi:uncharacterized protein (DUF433 family)